ncbi:hypothetical protein TWF128_000170 [Orbilia oligospora]|nr:hypothetical protein TWF128_000170 [Orbilia oligospora]
MFVVERTSSFGVAIRQRINVWYFCQRPVVCISSLLTQLIPTLGYEDICGFRTEDGNHQYAPFEPFNAPPLIRVTAGPSNYDLSKGLCINENERLVDYFNNFLDYETPKGPNFNPSYFNIQRRSLSQGLEIVDLHDSEFSRTWIDFNRCQRVPADGEVHEPPDILGSFPVLAVSDFKN